MKTEFSFQRALFLFCLFIGFLLVGRIVYTGRVQYLFLAWNLFLAWIPFIISGLFNKMINKSKWVQVFIFLNWLVFFPNALYIVTDLIHLELESIAPKWFDAVLLFSSAVTGLIMAFISLYRVEKYLEKTVNSKVGSLIVLVILFLGSFGVYLGRFLRWNSWDILVNPFGLLAAISKRFMFPFNHLQTWGITIVFTIFFYLLYAAIKKMPGYLNQANK